MVAIDHELLVCVKHDQPQFVSNVCDTVQGIVTGEDESPLRDIASYLELHTGYPSSDDGLQCLRAGFFEGLRRTSVFFAEEHADMLHILEHVGIKTTAAMLEQVTSVMRVMREALYPELGFPRPLHLRASESEPVRLHWQGLTPATGLRRNCSRPSAATPSSLKQRIVDSALSAAGTNSEPAAVEEEVLLSAGATHTAPAPPPSAASVAAMSCLPPAPKSMPSVGTQEGFDAFVATIKARRSSELEASRMAAAQMASGGTAGAGLEVTTFHSHGPCGSSPPLIGCPTTQELNSQQIQRLRLADAKAARQAKQLSSRGSIRSDLPSLAESHASAVRHRDEDLRGLQKRAELDNRSWRAPPEFHRPFGVNSSAESSPVRAMRRFVAKHSGQESWIAKGVELCL